MALQFWLRILEGAFRLRGVRRGQATTRGGFHLSYLEKGRKRAGSTVVLVHGLATSGLSWIRVLPRLGRAHHVVAVDLPGFGDSPPPSSKDFGTISDLVQALTEFLDLPLVGPQVVLVGSSLGGWVSAKVARRGPDRVEQLVLVNNAGVLYPEIGEIRDRMRVESRDQVNQFWQRMWHKVPFYYLYFWRDYITHMKQPNVTKFLDSITREDFINDDLPHLRMSTSVVWGMSDRFLPVEVVDVMLDALPRAQVYWLPRTGHIPQLERPRDFVQILGGILRRGPVTVPAS